MNEQKEYDTSNAGNIQIGTDMRTNGKYPLIINNNETIDLWDEEKHEYISLTFDIIKEMYSKIKTINNRGIPKK